MSLSAKAKHVLILAAFGKSIACLVVRLVSFVHLAFTASQLNQGNFRVRSTYNCCYSQVSRLRTSQNETFRARLWYPFIISVKKKVNFGIIYSSLQSTYCWWSFPKFHPLNFRSCNHILSSLKLNIINFKLKFKSNK